MPSVVAWHVHPRLVPVNPLLPIRACEVNFAVQRGRTSAGNSTSATAEGGTIGDMPGQSYERISARLGLTYLRWTNAIPQNAKPGFDTVVDTGQLVALMRQAVQAARKAG